MSRNKRKNIYVYINNRDKMIRIIISDICVQTSTKVHTKCVHSPWPKCYTKSPRKFFTQYQASSAVLGWLGDGDCYLMHTLMYIYRSHLLPFHHHCVPTKCAGFTRNQENSGNHSTGMTPSRLRTHIVSCRRKEAVQMSMKCR